MRRISLRLAITILLVASWLTGSSLKTAQSQALNQNPIYLIVAPELFTEELSDFILLQETRGFEVRSIWTSLEDSNPFTIKADIEAQLPMPKYVLLVGDTELLPIWTIAILNSTTTFYTDLPYSVFDWPYDYVPDTILGRLPVHNEGELSAYLTKLAAYYQNEWYQKWYPKWLKQISFVATDDGTIVDNVEAKFEGIINTFTAPNGYTGTFTGHEGFPASIVGGDRLFPTAYHATIEDVKNAVNDGRAALIYAGKGSSTTFTWNTTPSLTTTDVSNLDQKVIPFVAAFAPQTADYLTPVSMADAWILNPASGALTYLGATEDTYDEANLELAEGVFRGLFSSYSLPLSIGEAFQAGMQFLKYVEPGRHKEYHEIYQLFGDPSLTIRFPEGAHLTAPFGHFIAPWGGAVTLPITIKNVSPFEATFEVLVDSTIGYPLNIHPNPFDLTLSPDESTVIPIPIQIWTDLPVRTSYTVTISAAQKPEKIVNSTLTVTFQVFKPSVFFPIIYR